MSAPHILGLGVAGNFAGHLSQAGEDKCFTEVKTQGNVPKGLFPWYVPQANAPLGAYPVSSEWLHCPTAEQLKICNIDEANPSIQIEPEIIIDCTVDYAENGVVTALHPLAFNVFNDCSIRALSAKKLAHKKNWSSASKGVSAHWIPIDNFDSNGVLQNWNLTCFLERNGKCIPYTEDAPIKNYSYMYQTLLDWTVQQINEQTHLGPLEPILPLIETAGKPKRIWLAIGATAYTEFGEHNFLQDGDTSHIVAYDRNKHTAQNVLDTVRSGSTEALGKSVLKLSQKVLAPENIS